MAAIYVCSRCALDDCANCPGSVVAGRVTKRCACRHGAARPLARTTDPRTLGGAIVPDGDGAALIDTTRALIPSSSSVARLDNPSDGRELIALLLEGRVNRTPEGAAVLVVLDPDAAATIVTELVGLAARMGPAYEQAFRSRLDERFDVSELWPAVVPAGGDR